MNTFKIALICIASLATSLAADEPVQDLSIKGIKIGDLAPMVTIWALDQGWQDDPLPPMDNVFQKSDTLTTGHLLPFKMDEAGNDWTSPVLAVRRVKRGHERLSVMAGMHGSILSVTSLSVYGDMEDQPDFSEASDMYAETIADASCIARSNTSVVRVWAYDQDGALQVAPQEICDAGHPIGYYSLWDRIAKNESTFYDDKVILYSISEAVSEADDALNSFYIVLTDYHELRNMLSDRYAFEASRRP